MIKIIALSGKANSGKDTVAGMIEYNNNISRSNNDHIWSHVKFASKLKVIASVMLDVPVNKFEDRKFKDSVLGGEWAIEEKSFSSGYKLEKKKITVRCFLQDIGTKMREINPDFWINGLFSEFTPYCNWVISDLRYFNEAERVRKEGGKVVRVVRPGKEEQSDHLSETEMDTYGLYDYVIYNSGDLTGLREKVDKMLVYFKLKPTK